MEVPKKNWNKNEKPLRLNPIFYKSINNFYSTHFVWDDSNFASDLDGFPCMWSPWRRPGGCNVRNIEYHGTNRVG